MMKFILGVAIASSVLGLPFHAEGQVTDTTTTRPFVRGGVYDRPYLARLLGRTAIGGYAEMHARWQRVDGATEERGFEAKRWNIFTATEVSDLVRISAELEVEEGGEEIRLEYAAIDFRVTPAFALRAGMLLSPIGRFNLSHDSPMNEFTDRPLVSTEILGVALSEPGLGAFGSIPIGEGGRVTYEIYGVNGFNDGLINDSPDGTRIPEGRGNFEDNNASPAVVGRVTWSPSLDFELGLSAHHGAYNVFTEEGLQVAQRRDLTIGAVDFELAAAGFRLAGEAVVADIDIPDVLTDVYASRQQGLYVEVLRDFGHGWIQTIPLSFFSVGARLDIADLNADNAGEGMRQVTLGVNFRPTEDTVFKFNYVRGTNRDVFNNPSDHGGFLFSLATYF